MVPVPSGLLLLTHGSVRFKLFCIRFLLVHATLQPVHYGSNYFAASSTGICSLYALSWSFFASLCGSNLPLLPKVFFRIQLATLSNHDSQLSYEHNGDHAAFIVARGGSGSSHARRGGRGGHDFCGGRDSRGGGRTGGQGPHKCTHCSRSNHFVDYCWDLHGTPSRFASQVPSQ